MITAKKKYFTTRPWGFGSNIVNYLKSALFCDLKALKLILQDRNNTISNQYELFSVVKLPPFVTRTNTKIIVPIEDLKTCAKFILYSNYTVVNKFYYSVIYLFGLRNSMFLKNFNFDKEINLFFLENHTQYTGDRMLKYWQYTDDMKSVFSRYDGIYGYIDYAPDIAIQIRGGDKVQESLTEGVKIASIDSYLDICSDYILKCAKEHINIYVMTDTYSYFIKVKENIELNHSNVTVRSMVTPDQQGYQQADFNSLDIEQKKESYHFFLYELEMLRKSPICVGSFNSNIFYLASLIRYRTSSEYVSVDADVLKSFL